MQGSAAKHEGEKDIKAQKRLGCGQSQTEEQSPEQNLFVWSNFVPRFFLLSIFFITTDFEELSFGKYFVSHSLGFAGCFFLKNYSALCKGGILLKKAF